LSDKPLFISEYFAHRSHVPIWNCF